MLFYRISLDGLKRLTGNKSNRVIFVFETRISVFPVNNPGAMAPVFLVPEFPSKK